MGLSGRRVKKDRRWLSQASTRSAAMSSSQCAARPSLYFSYALLRIRPEIPVGGQVVPNTGGRNLCSIERSRGARSGCLSGKSHRAPVSSGRYCSFGTEGRSFGSRSTPQPGMRARSCSLDSAFGGFSGV
jgi:hypothetical protein